MTEYNFIHPAPGSRLTSGFGNRPVPSNTKKMQWHQGCDFAKTGNVPIIASADGIVRQYISDKTTYGNVLFIQHNIDGKQMDTTYAHLKSKLVKSGDKVKQGQVIGYMGNTDGGTKTSTGQHLHFEIHNGPWKSGQPNAVDPMKYIDVPKTTKKMPFNKLPEKLYLPPTTDKRSIYPTNKAPIKANAIAALNPKKFGGLTYDIIGKPQKDVVTIKTGQFGIVNIYVAPSTGAVIK